MAGTGALHHGRGYGDAKSPLLTALRANNIPAGLCSQRLAVEAGKSRLCPLGLDAVFLAELSGYRIDARGHTPGIEARLRPPEEKRALQRWPMARWIGPASEPSS